MNNIISTLGPVGTDSHLQAKRLGLEVSLHSSFSKAIDHALKNFTLLLLPAGFAEFNSGIKDTWIDFHFENISNFSLEKVWFDKTMEMTLLHRSYKHIAIHPSTSSLSNEINFYKKITYTKSKVEAYELFKNGLSDAAITSLTTEVITNHSRFIREKYCPTMVWCLYSSKSGDFDLASL